MGASHAEDVIGGVLIFPCHNPVNMMGWVSCIEVFSIMKLKQHMTTDQYARISEFVVLNEVVRLSKKKFVVHLSSSDPHCTYKRVFSRRYIVYTLFKIDFK